MRCSWPSELKSDIKAVTRCIADDRFCSQNTLLFCPPLGGLRNGSFRATTPGKPPFTWSTSFGGKAPNVGRKDQLCGFLKADIAGNYAGGRGCATGSDVCAGRSEGRLWGTRG
jgi:hypothetical protein